MIVKFLSKYFLEVIPSIVATVVGAYIVTHYINAKPDADKPKAAMTSPAETAKDIGEAARVEKAEPALAAKQPAEKPAETAGAPAETRRHQPMPREKSAAKAAPAPVPVEAVAKPDEARDANEIARAAIERLRGSEQPQPVENSRTQDAVRVQDTAKPQERARVNVTYQPSAPVQPPQNVQIPTAQPPAVQPMVQTPVIQAPPVANAVPPLNETTIAPVPQPVVRADDPSRPTPPADIPSRPLDLRTKERTSVAQDVVSTAKSVFHAVIPEMR